MTERAPDSASGNPANDDAASTVDFVALLTGFLLDELLDDLDEIDAEENLLADGMVDSLGMVRMVAFIEETLGVVVPPEDFTIENFQSLRVIAGYLRARLPGAAS